MLRFSIELLAVAALVGACGGKGSSENVDGAAQQSDAAVDGAVASRDRALVVSINREGNDADTVAVWTLKSDGSIIDDGPESDPVKNPRYVAISPSGREALCAWSLLAEDWGVVVIELEPDGSGATFSEPMVLGSGKNVFALSYADEDHAIVAVSSAGEHSLVALDRVGGALQLGATTPVPNEWPLTLVPGPDGRAAVMRALIASDPASEIYPLELGESGWVPSGDAVLVAPPVNIVERVGDHIYASARDPEDPVTPEKLEAGGILHTFAFSGAALTAEETFSLPHGASMIAGHPRGDYLVVPDVYYELSADDMPTGRGFRWQTVELDGDGLPISVQTDDTVVPAGLFNALELTPEGVMVSALRLLPDQAASEGEENPVQGYVRAMDGSWEAVGEPLYPDGLIRMAVATD